METDTRWKPQRYLDPDLAGAVAEAKKRTGLTWRQLARLTGVSHPHLVLISQGKRVPSDVTVEMMTDYLPIEADALERLCEVAVVKRRW